MKLQTLALCFLPAAASAQTSHETAALWGTMFRAFSCSFYAGMVGDTAERERLFTLGYEAGRHVLADLETGRVDEADSEGIGATVRLLLQDSPSQDFAIGRIFERVTNAALEHVHTERSLDFTKSIENARAVYESENCNLIR